MIHYIAMSGMRGCIPNDCHAFKTRSDAIDYLVELLGLPHKLKQEIKDYTIVDLALKKYGAEYAEVISCNCNNMEVHNDG
jgi:hypothetical protein